MLKDYREWSSQFDPAGNCWLLVFLDHKFKKSLVTSGAITWTLATIRSSFLNRFPTTSSFQIQLIIIPELVSSDNSNQKQLEALVVNHEPQSAGEMTNGWSIWQFKIAGHMDSQSLILLNLGRSKDGHG